MNIEDLGDVVRRAGEIALSYYNKDYTVTTKSDNSPVTEADTAVHTFLLDALKVTGIPVLSEEGTAGAVSGADKLWVVDPIDGTKDFIQKTGDFAVMVALVEKGVPVLAMVYVPVVNELYFAEKDKGAYVVSGNTQPVKLQVSKVSDSKEARMLVSRNHKSSVEEVLRRTLGVSNFIPMGSIGVKLCVMARGDAELYANPYSHLGWWDVAAPQLILEEAGGQVTGFDGSEIRYVGKNFHVPQARTQTNNAKHDLYVCGRGVFASNKVLHNKILTQLVDLSA